MLSANTYPPVPETTGLLDIAQSSLLRLLVGLKLTPQRKKAADQKLLSAADTGCGNSWESQHCSVRNCNALSTLCKSGCACSNPLYTGGGYNTCLISGRNQQEGSILCFFSILCCYCQPGSSSSWPAQAQNLSLCAPLYQDLVVFIVKFFSRLQGFSNLQYLFCGRRQKQSSQFGFLTSFLQLFLEGHFLHYFNVLAKDDSLGLG